MQSLATEPQSHGDTEKSSSVSPWLCGQIDVGWSMLEVRGVTKIFNAGTPNEVRSLQGVDLNLDEGEFVIIIGTNGSGKSTLLNAVAGTFLVDSGAIRLAGQDVTRWPEHRRARLI